jgi:tripartite-type tricarboxylate transporter receptor subunit TctC
MMLAIEYIAESIFLARPRLLRAGFTKYRKETTMRALSRLVLFLFLSMATLSTALAQPATDAAPNYPSRQIRLVYPYAAGGPGDIVARIVAAELTKRWHQSVIVETKPGAGGNIAMDYVARSRPDGYTLVVAPTANLVINQHLYPHLHYDPFKNFTPLTLMVTIDNMLVVNNSIPAHSVKELAAYAKANPGKLTYGSSGIGTQPHLAGEMFKHATGINMLHVPYNGTADATTAILGGHISALFTQVSAVAPLIKAGKLNAIGIGSATRSPLLPNVPTLQEQGLKGFEAISIYALMAPSGTPAPIVSKLSTAVREILRMPSVNEKITKMGMNVVADTPEQLAALMRQESASYAKIIKDDDIKLQ